MTRSLAGRMAFVFFLLALGGRPAAIRSQVMEPPPRESVEAARSAPLFLSHEVLDLTIEADFKTIRREDRTRDSRVERPAVLRWRNPDGSPQTLDAQVRTRGNFRLSRRNCEFPPLRINVKKQATEGTLFEGEEKLKLVVTCRLRPDTWEQYVLLEYGAYRTLNLLTDRSFRVRQARVTYVDTSGDQDPFTRFAFLIEDAGVLATRNEALAVEWTAGQLDPRLVEKRAAILVDVFQYMIGNTDWSGVQMHNVQLIRTADNVPYTVPYDFDFSGLVNAQYATPDPSLSISRVRQRLFRGFCPDQMNRSQADYDAVYSLFRERKDEIYEMWRGIEGLEGKRLKDTLSYLDEFYEILGNPRSIENQMIRNCRRIGT